MADAAEVAIMAGLFARLNSVGLSPALPIAWPNVEFTPLTAEPGIMWLRGTFLPADTFALSIDHGGSNRHSGFLQVDVFSAQKSGEPAPARIAAAIINHFARGTSLSQDGFMIKIHAAPSRAPLVKDDPWIMIPVRIPYVCFATNPA